MFLFVMHHKDTWCFTCELCLMTVSEFLVLLQTFLSSWASFYLSNPLAHEVCSNAAPLQVAIYFQSLSPEKKPNTVIFMVLLPPDGKANHLITQNYSSHSHPHLSHELLGGEHKFMIYHPARQIFKHTAVRMYHHCLLMFGCFVLTTFRQSSHMIEVSSCDGLQR